MNKIIITALFLIYCQLLSAQIMSPSVYSAAGAFLVSENAQLSLTVGEPVIANYIAQDQILNAGFQQVETFLPITRTWTGILDDDWIKSGNWSPAGIPVSIDDVIIPGALPVLPVIKSAGYSCRNLTVSDDATLKIDAGITFTIYGTGPPGGP
jgi:hypothetical protein